MRRSITLTVALLMGTVAPYVGAEPFSWYEEFCASATANVFDGGPVTTQSGCGSHENESGFLVSVSDGTQNGSLGARTIATTKSRFSPGPDALGIEVHLLAGYFPSLTSGGDNPGGMAEAELHSVIEFEMPADELQWFYRLDIDNPQPNPFVGSTSVLVENVTRSTILLELDADTPNTEAVLAGAAGDLISITTVMTGSGSMGPGSTKEYEALLLMGFIVPEPTTLFLLTVGAVVMGGRNGESRPLGRAGRSPNSTIEESGGCFRRKRGETVLPGALSGVATGPVRN